MYTATKSSPPPEAVTSQPQNGSAVTSAETLTYWTDSRTMARPNPSVSNCGLVIVQVDQPPTQRGPTSYSEASATQRTTTYYAHPHPEQPHAQTQLTNWSNITLDNRIFQVDAAGPKIMFLEIFFLPALHIYIEVQKD